MITIKNLSKTYKNNQIGIKNVNLELPSQGLVIVSGQSGSGKSTLLNCLSGLDSYTTGQIFINDTKVSSLSDYATVIFQEMNLIEDLTVSENITFSVSDNNLKDKLDDILEKLGILNIKNSHVNQISGGQRQRVAIARALIKNSQVIFCDEPTASLDETNARELFTTLKLLAKDKLIIVVTHQDKLALEYTDSIIRIKNNEIVESNVNVSNEATNLTVVTKESLDNKAAAKMAFKNILQNKIKTIMTFLFLIVSVAALAFLTTILTIDLDKVTYDSFVNTNQEYVQFNRNYEDRFYSTKSGNISNEALEQIDPDLISYDDINYHLVYRSNSIYIHSVWVTNKNIVFNQTINDYEVIIASDIADVFSIDHESLINTYFTSGGADLKIVGILTNSVQGTIIMNSNTFLEQNANLLLESRINVKLTQESYSSPHIFNPLAPNGINNNRLLMGTLPQEINEICVNDTILTNLFPNSNLEQLIGTNITLDFSDRRGGAYNSYTFKLTGISDDSIIFYDSQVQYFINNYGNSRINAGTIGAVFTEFNLNTFTKASSLLIFPQGEVREQVVMAYTTLLGFKDILIGLAIITLLIAVITILNSVATAILKSKKDLGVLISFNIKPKSLSKIFLLENLLIFLSSVLVATFSYAFLVSFLNTKIYEEWKLNVTLLRFEAILYLVIIVSLLILIMIVVLLALIKLIRKRPIDIIYNR